jgi:hypothetical protein
MVGPKSAAYKQSVLSATRAAIVEEFGVDDGRVVARVVESAPEDVSLPPCRTARMTVFDVLMYTGRSAELKHAMTAALREKLAADPGIEPSEVAVHFHDAAPEDLLVLPGQASAS